METIQTNKGYLDTSNCVMTNRKFKHFGYLDDIELKENPILDFKTDIKINAMAFYRVIEMLNKIKQIKVRLTTNKDNLKISIDEPLFKLDAEIKSLDSVENSQSSIYSIELLNKFLKEYSTKDLNIEFINLSFSEDYPLMIKFKEDWIILAPRVE